MKKRLLYFLSFFVMIGFNAEAQSKRKKKEMAIAAAKAKEQKALEEKKNDSKIKPYDKVITSKAISDKGLFTTHKVGDNHYFEIPKKLLNKEMLLVSRISKIPSGLGGGYVNAGSSANEQLIVWEQFQDKILIRVKSYAAVASDSLPIHISVKANNYEPILYAFDIASYSKDSSAVVVDVTKFYSSDIKALSGLNSRMRDSYKVKNLDSSRSFISSIKSFPENIEVIQDFTYVASAPSMLPDTETISIQMNQSMILLPEEPMQPRLFDRRVGWFTINQYDYGSEALKADEKTYIRRWRLVPKDIDAYNRGELVEPIKPIVYYLDPATPEKLKKFIKAGVEEWQKPFEAAGFKNAIICKDAPTKEEDPDFSPEDIRYSVIRYVASTTRNAVGPSVSDPRTGEIIESDIIWYHNHLRSYRNRYLLETGAANPDARTLNTSDEAMGEMMQMVIAHEVGHALGFPHNMGASCAYEVENYRKAPFTKQFGISASIMDYARYNYIAQPGDEGVRFIRQMGPYDYYAVNWGYRFYSEYKKPEEEVATLSNLITSKENDPIFRFGNQSSRFDPRSQTEDIGNNSVLASTYAIKNLKIVAKNLPKWTSDKTNNYDDLEELYNELLSTWNRYVGHVITNVGGVYEDYKNPNQNGKVYTPTPKDIQINAMKWLQMNLFGNINWLIDDSILQNVNHTGYLEKVSRYQINNLESLLSLDRMSRLLNAELMNSKNYSVSNFFVQINEILWSELTKGQKLSLFRRNLQKAYIDSLQEIIKNKSKNPNLNLVQEEIKSYAIAELKKISIQISKYKNLTNDAQTLNHYLDCSLRIKDILEK